MLLCAGEGAELWGCSVRLELQGRNSKICLELGLFLPSNPQVWPFQSSRRFGGKRGNSQGGEKKSPESINIPRCRLAAAAAHTKTPVHLQGCQDGSAKAAKTPLATATSSCSAGREGAPRAAQHPALVPSTPVCPARSLPLGDRHWGGHCSFQGDVGDGNQIFMDVSPF